MANKQSQDTPSGYMDGVRVKISEKYKPPPRINLPMSYQQRLSLNKQIQDSIPDYNFMLDKTVKEKMLEWRTARSVILEEQKIRLEKAREQEKKRLEQLKEIREKEEEELMNAEKKSVTTGTNVQEDLQQTYYLNSLPSQSYQQTSAAATPGGGSNGGGVNQTILIPTQVTTNTYSNILTPIPLKDNVSYNNQSFPIVQDKSPFNISDFEADTSSPFDNMELKSINDMEELAQVLKKDGAVPYTTTNYTSSNMNQTNYSYGGGAPIPNIGSSYSYNIPNNNSFNIPSSTSNYNQSNGYYYPPVTLQNRHSSYSTTPYSYSNQIDTNYIQQPPPPPPPSQQQQQQTDLNDYQLSCTTSSIVNNTVVPDILKSLNEKLNNSHIDNTRNTKSYSSNINCSNSNIIISKNKDISCDYSVNNGQMYRKSDMLDNPFDTLPKNIQDLCRSISSMGFPLDRVARVAKIVGNDEKTIVDHLLAMSELLVLGFPEENVSKALIESNNDRDKALDLLTL